MGRIVAAAQLIPVSDLAAREAVCTGMLGCAVAALRDELGAGLRTLPEGRVRAPFRQPCAVEEFHVNDPGGFVMLFAEVADAGLTG